MSRGKGSGGTTRGCLEQTLPAAQAPFRREAGECEQKNDRLMPERCRPILGDGNMLVGESSGELIQLLGRDHFSSCFLCDLFEKRPVGRKGAKLICRRVRGPPRRGMAHG